MVNPNPAAITFFLVVLITTPMRAASVSTTSTTDACAKKCLDLCETKDCHCDLTAREFKCKATTTTTTLSACETKCLAACDIKDCHCDLTAKTYKCKTTTTTTLSTCETKCLAVCETKDCHCDLTARTFKCKKEGVSTTTTTTTTTSLAPTKKKEEPKKEEPKKEKKKETRAPDNPNKVSNGLVNEANKWHKKIGFRCARDNRVQFWFQSWWYNSIIRNSHKTIEECMRFCEKDPNCGACDWWPGAAQGTGIRSFFLCDLRDQAPCPNSKNFDMCSQVMILERPNKNWYQKARECDIHTCDYSGKSVRAMHYDWYGIYQGGTIGLFSDAEDEIYGCTRQSTQSVAVETRGVKSNPGHCVEWDAMEKDIWHLGKERVETEFGKCFCFNQPDITPWLTVQHNSHYCAQWSCYQTESSSPTLLGTLTARSTRTYSDWYSKYGSEREVTNCACTVESQNRRFCMVWECQENTDLSAKYFVDWNEFDSLETEVYTCEGTDGRLEVDQKFGVTCTKWTGVIVARDEFELSTCEFTDLDAWKNKRAWKCKEEGWGFWHRQWSATIVSLLLYVGLGVGWGVSLGRRGDSMVCSLWFHLANTAVWTLFLVMFGGFVGWILGILFYIPAVVINIVCKR